MSEVIDAHQHFWQREQPFDYGWLKTPALEPICRDYLPEDLSARIGKAGVDRTVFVQTQHEIEANRWVLGLAEQNDFIAEKGATSATTRAHTDERAFSRSSK